MKSNIYLNIHINQYANKNLKSLVAKSIKKSVLIIYKWSNIYANKKDFWFKNITK